MIPSLNWVLKCLRGTATLGLSYCAGMLACIGYLYLVPSLFDYWGPATKALEERDYATAADYYGKIIELRPVHFASHLNRGYALAGLGDFDAALASFDTALEIKPHDSTTLALRATVLIHQARFEEAAHVSAQVSSVDSSYFYLQYSLAYHLIEACRLERAEEVLQQAISSDTTWTLGYLSLGVLLNRSGRPREARVALSRARILDPSLGARDDDEFPKLPIPIPVWHSKGDSVEQTSRED